MVQNRVDLTIDELKKVGAFVHKHTGVYLEDEKLKRFKRKVEDILIKNSIDNFSNFYHKIRFQKDEKLTQELINAVTINETYFWREYEQFEILSKEILPKIVENSTSTPHIRILVLPTSSGEELYSIMISILEEGSVIERANIEIIGIDIDSDMIKKAKRGVYTKRSVDKLPKDILERYFRKAGELYQIDSNLIKYANFLHANLFDLSLQAKLGSFDIIFSRNMLIYFNMDDKTKALEIFYKLLKKEGYLFLGHADANGIDKKRFQPIKTGFHIFKKI